MSRIRVDPDVLHQLGHEVRDGVGVARAVRAGHDALAAHAAAAGHPDANEAITDFLEAWAYGCGHLVSDAEHLADLLEHAGAIYIEVDDRVGTAMAPRH